jgi:hypothetical protein
MLIPTCTYQGSLILVKIAIFIHIFIENIFKIITLTPCYGSTSVHLTSFCLTTFHLMTFCQNNKNNVLFKDVSSNDILSNDILSNDILSNDIWSNNVWSNNVSSNNVWSNNILSNDGGLLGVNNKACHPKLLSLETFSSVLLYIFRNKPAITTRDTITISPKRTIRRTCSIEDGVAEKKKCHKSLENTRHQVM